MKKIRLTAALLIAFAAGAVISAQVRDWPQEVKNKFEQKAWFRFLKVLYVIAYLAVIGGVLVIGFTVMPA